MELTMRGTIFVMITLVLSALTLPMVFEEATAHSPTFPGENSSMAKATHVDDPSKSWVIYTHLEETAVNYYAIDLKAGDRLYLNLIVPTNEKGTGFRPDLVITGPFTDKNGILPMSVELPADSGWRVIDGVEPDTPTYEPFTPGTFLNLAVFDEHVPVDGRYYVVVFQDPGLAAIHGDYGLAVGYVESFTIAEFILIPFSLLNVYQWEGQSLIQLFVPMVAVFLVGAFGMYLLRRESFTRMGLVHMFALISGLLFMSTAANTIIQMLISISQAGLVAGVLVTLIFIAAPLLLGWMAISMALSGKMPWTIQRRIGLFAIGLVGLVVWGGLMVGPIIAMVGSVMPVSRTLKREGRENRTVDR